MCITKNKERNLILFDEGDKWGGGGRGDKRQAEFD